MKRRDLFRFSGAGALLVVFSRFDKETVPQKAVAWTAGPLSDGTQWWYSPEKHYLWAFNSQTLQGFGCKVVHDEGLVASMQHPNSGWRPCKRLPYVFDMVEAA